MKSAPPPSVSPSQPETAKFLEFWRERVCRRGALPSREEVDPAEIKAILPNVWIYERLALGRYFCRVAGEEISLRWRLSLSRKLLSDISSAQEHAIIQARFEIVLGRRLLAFGASRVRDGWVMERIYGPVLDGPGEPRLILGCSSPIPWQAAREVGRHPRVNDRMDFFDPISLVHVPVNPGSGPDPIPAALE